MRRQQPGTIAAIHKFRKTSIDSGFLSLDVLVLLLLKIVLNLSHESVENGKILTSLLMSPIFNNSGLGLVAVTHTMNGTGRIYDQQSGSYCRTRVLGVIQ